MATRPRPTKPSSNTRRPRTPSAVYRSRPRSFRSVRCGATTSMRVASTSARVSRSFGCRPRRRSARRSTTHLPPAPEARTGGIGRWGVADAHARGRARGDDARAVDGRGRVEDAPLISPLLTTLHNAAPPRGSEKSLVAARRLCEHFLVERHADRNALRAAGCLPRSTARVDRGAQPHRSVPAASAGREPEAGDRRARGGARSASIAEARARSRFDVSIKRRVRTTRRRLVRRRVRIHTRRESSSGRGRAPPQVDARGAGPYTSTAACDAFVARSDGDGSSSDRDSDSDDDDGGAGRRFRRFVFGLATPAPSPRSG